MEKLEKKIRAYALKNAIAHEGKAMQGPVMSSLFSEGLDKKEVGKQAKRISEILLEINSLSLEEQKKQFEKVKDDVSERETHEGLDELPNAEKGVLMRFRPAPSGPLHLGHIISNMASSLYVKKYGGKFYVIIDDTDPKTTLASAYADIPRDCNWIFGNVSEYLVASDRMALYYEYVEKLIDKKSAYICTCSQEKFKKFVEEKKDCPCRKLSVKENMERWNKMLDKKGFAEGKAVLRFKSDMKHKNPAMRDFPLARISETPHPRQGDKYRVLPLMNLSVVVDDMELKMTHIIRGKDHRDNAERQRMIFDIFKKKFPWVFFIGRFKFTDLVMSKRKLTAAIKSGEFSGEEDERIPTIASLRKRGYQPKAFAQFIEQRGLSEVDKVMDSKEFFQLLDNFNRQ
jgi:glutamyl-tRNA synthetase